MKPSLSQTGILAAPLPVGRSLVFRTAPDADASAVLKKLGKGFSTSWGVMGAGEPLVCALGLEFVAYVESLDGMNGSCDVWPASTTALSTGCSLYPDPSPAATIGARP